MSQGEQAPPTAAVKQEGVICWCLECVCGGVLSHKALFKALGLGEKARQSKGRAFKKHVSKQVVCGLPGEWSSRCDQISGQGPITTVHGRLGSH